MKLEILNRIKELGGNIDNVRGNSLKEDLLSIHFDTVLYPKRDITEPIYGISKFMNENIEVFRSDEKAFYTKMLDTFFCLTEKGHGQDFWKGELFTPFKEGSKDFNEWQDIFEEYANLETIYEIVDDPKPDFILSFYRYGFPDHYYICLSDPNPENPTVFGTDHEEFFEDITNRGSLEDFLQDFMTKDELLKIVKKKIEKTGWGK